MSKKCKQIIHKKRIQVGKKEKDSILLLINKIKLNQL